MSEEQRADEDEERQAEESGSSPNADAMGLDKRRTVMGGQYGATLRKQLTIYGIFLAVMVVLVVGFVTIVGGYDNREIALEDTAPWAQADAPNPSPRPLDFPQNGPLDTIPREDIGKAVLPEENTR